MPIAETNGTDDMLMHEAIKDIGMTDKQFNGFVRFVLDDNKEVLAEMQETYKIKA